MSRATKLATLLATFALTASALASEGEGVAPSAAKLVDFGGGWAITNSIFTGWVISALLVTLILALVGALPSWGYSRSWGYFPSGGLGLILVIIIVLVLLGRI